MIFFKEVKFSKINNCFQVKKWFLFHLLLILCSTVNAQSQKALAEIDLNSISNKVKVIENSERSASSNESNDIKAVLVKSENGISTYQIYNEILRRELFLNKEKRDALTILPGLIEIGIPSVNEPMRVVMDDSYAVEYLKIQFNVNN
jgi:hypothetical protein